ncbi:MAG TPA: hypothetical protein VIR03_01920 [Candidatus Saccharimonadales bacterium]
MTEQQPAERPPVITAPDTLPVASEHHEISFLQPSWDETLAPEGVDIRGAAAVAVVNDPESGSRSFPDVAASMRRGGAAFAVATNNRGDMGISPLEATEAFLDNAGDVLRFDTPKDASQHVAQAYRDTGIAELTAGRIVQLSDGNLYCVFAHGSSTRVYRNDGSGILRCLLPAITEDGAIDVTMHTVPLTPGTRNQIILASGESLTVEELGTLYGRADATSTLIHDLADRGPDADQVAMVIDVDVPGAQQASPEAPEAREGAEPVAAQSARRVSLHLPRRRQRSGQLRAANVLGRLKMYELDPLTREDASLVAQMLGLEDFSKLSPDTDLSLLTALRQVGDAMQRSHADGQMPEVWRGVEEHLRGLKQKSDAAPALAGATDQQLNAMTRLITESIYAKKAGMDSKVVRKAEELLSTYVRAANNLIGDKLRDRASFVTPGSYVGAVLLNRVTGGPVTQERSKDIRTIKARGATAKEVLLGNAALAVATVSLATLGVKTYLNMRHGIDLSTGGGNSPGHVETTTHALPTTHPTTHLTTHPTTHAEHPIPTTSTPKPEVSVTPTPTVSGAEHPVPTPNPTKHYTHHIIWGENLSGIADQQLRAMHVSAGGGNLQRVIEQIAHDNNIPDVKQIYAGKTLNMDGTHRMLEQMQHHTELQAPPPTHSTAPAVTQHAQETISQFSNTDQLATKIHETPIKQGEGVLSYLKRLGVNDPALRTKLVSLLNQDSHLQGLRAGLMSGSNPVMYAQGATELRLNRPGTIDPEAAQRLANMIARIIRDHRLELLSATK